jgi:hypothetical protein
VRPVLFVESLTRFLQSYQPGVGLPAGPPFTKPAALLVRSEPSATRSRYACWLPMQ